MADETVGTAESGVDAGAYADEAAGDGEAEIVVLCEQADNTREDGTADCLAFGVFLDDAGSDLDLVAEFENAGQDGAAGDATFEVLDLGAGFVDVEGADDDHMWSSLEVADGDGDFGDEGFVDGVDVVFQLGGDGDDGAAVGDGAFDELLD